VVDVADDGGSLTVHVGGGVAIVGEGRFDLPFQLAGGPGLESWRGA